MATAQIKVAGTDLTANVVFASALFESAVNGATGPCKFRVRDDNADITLVTGSIIELLIDGDPIWTGYLTHVNRVYAFPAENVAEAGLTRWFDIEGTDLNILFTKRIVVRAAAPANVYGKLYGPGSPDNVAVADLVADFLDLSGDALDTSTKVESVADINVDQNARPWSSGYTWGQAMASIAMLPAAVYCLDPERFLVYTDVNTASAALGLSDQPGAGQAGYREMTILKDGAELANDVLAWGMGYGSAVPVLVRDEDAASQALHGLWQRSVVTTGIYKQATINRVAASIVDGSPSSKRGAKDDRVAVSLVTYEPGFLPAQKVAFESNVFGFSDVIPIRKMKVTFEAPDVPRYELTLSHAIDDPWSFIDPFRFDFNLPPFPRLPPLPLFPPPPIPCGITDTFNRPDGPPGISDSGRPWEPYPGEDFDGFGPPGGLIVDGRLDLNAGGNANAPPILLLSDPWYTGPGIPYPVEWTVEFELTGLDIPIVTFSCGWSVWFHPTTDTVVVFGLPTDYEEPFTFAAGVVYKMRTYWDPSVPTAAVYRCRIWPVADPEPSTWLHDHTFSLESFTPSTPNLWAASYSGDPPALAKCLVGNLDINGVDRCTAPSIFIDNFDRTLIGYVGCASSGLEWQGNTIGDPDSRVSVDGKFRYASSVNASGTLEWLDVPRDPRSSEVVFDVGLKAQLYTGNQSLNQANAANMHIIIERREGASLLDTIEIDFFLESESDAAGGDDYIQFKLDVDDPGASVTDTFAAGTIPVESQAVATFTETSVTASWLGHALTLPKTWATPSVAEDVFLRIKLQPALGVAGTQPGPVDQYATLDNLQGDFPLVTQAVVPECVPSGSEAPTMVGPDAHGCETPVRLSQVVYGTSREYAPGSTEVFRAGLLQRRIVDYVENAGYTMITFNEEVHISTPVRICYQAAIT